VRLIDTHAHVHYESFDADRADVLARAEADGVVRIINIGYDLPSGRASVALANEHASVWATVGIQPHYALETTPEHLAEVERLLAEPKVVALGEIGLDYYHNRAPAAAQHELFRAQLAIARHHNMPVVIHTREAQADTLQVLREAAQGLTIIMHAFSGDWAYAQACLDLGAFLSLAGPVTFPKATDLHAVAQWVPLDRLLIETDSPFLSPHPFRGKRNEPARVRLVAERIAALRGICVDDIAAATWHNAQHAFPKLGQEPRFENREPSLHQVRKVP
jgi:TatD DNase family protein